mmetsp:Transcript_23322/g.20702  ORF Transcript_23322/g.20702 Transcript_23322/m.20702 type:complete len:92 (-) Transcript_23322:293-568(-)
MNFTKNLFEEENLSDDVLSEDVSSSGVPTNIRLIKNMTNSPFKVKTKKYTADIFDFMPLEQVPSSRLKKGISTPGKTDKEIPSCSYSNPIN